MMSQEIAEFEIGKRHLARIMSIDEDNITQDDINVSLMIINEPVVYYYYCYACTVYYTVGLVIQLYSIQ